MILQAIAFLALAVIISTAAVDVNRTARVECYDNGDDYSMIFTVTSNSDSNLGFVYALNSTDDKVYKCSSDAELSYFTTAPDLSEFKITINVTKDYVPDAECGHSNSTADVFEWRFLTTKFSMIVVKSIDILFVAQCNFSDASSTVVSTGSVTVAGNLAENAAPDETISFGLSVVGNTGSDMSTVQLGDMVNLKITQLTGRAVNMTGHSCWASSDNYFSNSDYKLVESTGCPVDIGDGTSLMASGFVGGSPSSTSGAFEQFKFLGSNSVYYRCTVVYCFTGDSDCEDYCALNGGSRRRKRDADEPTQTEITETSVKITLNELPIVNDIPDCPPQIVETFNPPTRAEDSPRCLESTGVIAAFGAMGGMLLLTAGAAAFVYMRSAKLSQMSSKSA